MLIKALLIGERVAIEGVLQLLVGGVYEKLFVAVVAQVLEAECVQNTYVYNGLIFAEKKNIAVK